VSCTQPWRRGGAIGIAEGQSVAAAPPLRDAFSGTLKALWVPILLFVAALALRALVAAHMSWLVDEIWAVDIFCSWFLKNLPAYLLQLTHGVSPPEAPYFTNPPLAFWIMTCGMWVGSKFGATALFSARFVNAVLGSLRCVGVYLIGTKSGGKAVGYAAAVLVALSPALIALDASAYIDTTLSLLFVVSLYFILRFMETRSSYHLFSLAVSLGLVLLTKFAVAWLFLGSVVVVVVLLLITWSASWRAKALRFLAFLLVVLGLPLAIWSGARDPAHLAYIIRWFLNLSTLRGAEQGMFGEYTVANGGLISNPWYYLVMLFGRTTPVVSILTCLVLISWFLASFSIIKLRKKTYLALSFLLVNSVVVLVIFGLVGGPASTMHRIAPFLPFLLLALAFGVVWAIDLLPLGELKGAAAIRIALFVSVLALQVTPLLTWRLEYLNVYNNFLIGGLAGGSRYYRIGDGEGMDRAGQWLRENTLPTDLVACVRFGLVLQKYIENPIYHQPFNQSLEEARERGARYLVVHRSHTSGGLRPAFLGDLASLEIAHSVMLGQTSLIDIYRIK